MHIYPINSFTKSNYNYHKQPAFTAHPDFYKFYSTQSCYFRRGCVALANNKGYANIENLFYSIFNTDLKEPKKMLIIGIGNSQETFSYLASIKGIIKDKAINKNVDLYTVDLQSKPNQEKLRLDSFSDLFEYEEFPIYAGLSFIKDERFPQKPISIDYMSPAEIYFYMRENLLKRETLNSNKIKKSDYRVNDEILNFVKLTYNNSKKSKWDSRIQDVIIDYPTEEFDIISANNVLVYIDSDEEFYGTIKHIYRTLKKGGYFITDPYNFSEDKQLSKILNKFKYINPGIYQKV